MAPEYLVYIPVEAKDQFEAYLRRMDGAQTYWKRIPASEIAEIEETPEDISLAQRSKSVIDILPKSTRLKDLTKPQQPSYIKKRDGINTPPEWAELMGSLTRNERKIVGSNLSRFLNQSLWSRQDSSIGDLKEMDWKAFMERYKEIHRGMTKNVLFARRVFGEVS